MTIRLRNDLAAILVLSALLIIIIVFVPSNVVRIIIGLPFILLFPGYTLIAALFPHKADWGGVERLALSLGLSIAVVPLLGLILNYTPWGISLYPMLGSIGGFILLTSCVAWYRRRRLPAEERFFPEFDLNLSQWTKAKRLDKVLYAVLAVSIVAAIGTVTYVTVTPREQEKFTEFYVLGLDGQAHDYPSALSVGEEGRVILGIVSHEYRDDLGYLVAVMLDGEDCGTIGPILLDHEEKWEQETGFTPTRPGEDQKVEFLLYKDGADEPYSSLYVWLDVTGTG